MNKWDKRFLELAEHFSTWSKDPSTKVGCVLGFPEEKEFTTYGFNGFAKGEPDDAELYLNREYKYENVMHAEINALAKLSEFGPDGYTLYTNFPPCSDCANTIVRSQRVTRIVSYNLTHHVLTKSPEWLTEWSEQLHKTWGILDKAGIPMELHTRE